jgi:hypothetical protein
MKEQKEDQGFVFKDRRKISVDDQEQRPEESREEPARESASEEQARTDFESAARQTESPGEGAAPLPEVNFSTFIFSLSSSALVHLGEIPEPGTQRVHQDLQLAKQIIDTLGMMDEKTRGNLDGNEERLLKSVLYDLRMRFVQKSK